MNDLVIISPKGNPTTTSRIVAEVFGKEHKHVLRDIRELKCSEQFRKSNFGLLVEIKQLPQGGSSKLNYYTMTKDGFTILVMGYKGTRAMEFKEKYIEEFNKTQKFLNSDDYIIKKAMAILNKRIEEKETLIEDLKPQLIMAQAIKTTQDTIDVGTFANILKQNGVDTGANRLFAWLRANGYLIKKGPRKNRPTAAAMQAEFFTLQQNPYIDQNGKERLSIITKITGKGQEHLLNIFLTSNNKAS